MNNKISVFLIISLLFSSCAHALRIRDEFNIVGDVSELNCTGSGISCSKNSDNALVLDMTVSGGGGGGGGNLTATYITQTTDAELVNEQALSSLSTGIVKNTNGTGVLSIASAGTDYYNPGGTDVALADGGTGVSLADPNADQILFWDDSLGALTWLTVDSPLTLSGTNLGLSTPLSMANGGFGIALTDPNADLIPFWDDSAGTFVWLEPNSSLTISGTQVGITVPVPITDGGTGGITRQAAIDNLTDSAGKTDGYVYTVTSGSGGWAAPPGQIWTDSGTVSYLTETTDDAVIGASAVVDGAKVSIDGDEDETTLALKAHTAQTAPLLTGYDSSGTALISIGSDGSISGQSGTTGSMSSGTSAGNTLKLRAYDVDGATYTDAVTITSNNTPTYDLHTETTVGSAYIYRNSGTDISLADGGTGASLADPNADRILFWDDSAGSMTWLTVGSNLTITDTTISASGGGSGTTYYRGVNMDGASTADDTLACDAGTTLDNLKATGGMIVYARFKFNTYGEGGNGRIVDKNGAGASGWQFYFTGAGSTTPSLEFDHDGSTDLNRSTSTTLTAGTWYVSGVEWDGGVTAANADIYICASGGACSEAAYTSSISGVTLDDDSALTLTIGNRSGATDRTFDGVISEVAIWSGISGFSADERSYLSDLSNIGKWNNIRPANMVSYWKMSECGDGATCTSELVDSKGANSCTASGSPTGYLATT